MKKTHVACGVTALTLALGACGMSGNGPSESTDGSNDSRHMVIDEPFAPAADWALETDDAFVLSKLGCLETLVARDAEGVLEPMLATSWDQVRPNAWEFDIRDGVEFQNGRPMDAEAVAGALDHLLQAKAPVSAFSPDVIDDVEVVNKGTVRITTVKPDALIPERLAIPNTGILAPKAYQGSGTDPVGTCTGAFTITKEVPQQAVHLKRNSSYWGGAAKLETAEVRFIADGAKRATQIQTGEAQLARKLPVTSVETVKDTSGVEIDTADLSRTASLILNNKKAPFDNEKVRQAIQAAIDTKKISEAVYPGAARPAVGPFAPKEPFAPADAKPVEADPEKAKSLLAEAGVKASSIEVNLLAYTEGTSFADLAAVIQDQLKAIGIKVTIKTADYASMEPDMLSGNFDMALMSRNYLADMPDPLGVLAADYSCDGDYNISQFCDPKMDALIKKAQSTKSQEKRYRNYAQAASDLQSRAVNIFLVHETESVARANVTGYAIHPYYTLTADLALISE